MRSGYRVILCTSEQVNGRKHSGAAGLVEQRRTGLQEITGEVQVANSRVFFQFLSKVSMKKCVRVLHRALTFRCSTSSGLVCFSDCSTLLAVF